MRELVTVCATVVALLCAACGGSDDEEDLTPIVFVHGCPPAPITNEQAAGLFTGDTQGMPDNGTTDFYAERGYPDDYLNVIQFDGPNCPPNRDFAEQIETYVADVLERTGKERVDMIGWSMGALASRIYIKNGGYEFVEDYASICGASHGSRLAGMLGEAGQEQFGYPNWEGAIEASPEYACEGQSTEADVQFYINGCLTADGRTVEEDETPFDIDEGGHTRYLSVWNEQDDLVSPPEASCLNQAFQNDCSDPVNVMISVPARTEVIPGSGIYSAHVETEFDPDSRQLVYDFLTEPRD